MPAQDAGKKEPNRRKPHWPRRKTNNPAVSGVAAFIHAYHNEQEANRQQEGREDRGKRRRDIATLVFVILTTIGIFGQAWILHNSDDAIQKSATAAKDSADAAKTAAEAAKQSADATIALERPHFFITGKFNKPDGTENSNPQIAYSIANIGRVPGIARMVYAECSLKTAFDGLPILSKSKFRSAQTAIGGNLTATEFPPVICGGMTPENWTAIHSKAKTIIFQAVVMYEGALNYTYVAMATYTVDPDTGYFYAVGGDDYNYDTSEKGRGSGKPHTLPKITE
jgi:hypothetical protein